MELQELKNMATQVRRDIVRMVHGVQSGHPGGSLGCTDYVVALYFGQMQHDPKFNMEGKNEDVFFLSNGHISPLFYSVLARSGYFPTSELSSFRQINSRLQGHPATHEHLPGVRIASGSLGQGLSVASGMAYSKKMDKDGHTVFALTGDGELQEGQNWEAIMFAAHHQLDNLIIAVDYNGQQIDGPTKNVMDLGDIKAKFIAFGWEVLEIEKGNEMESVLSGILNAKQYLGKKKPICILLKTEMGAGVSFMEGTHEWHGIAPNDEQLAKALSELPETIGDY
ncbi:MAG TPA: transketolase [Edaphocola sp.]|nr:transketolase [Edaphocola sp.]